FDPSVVRGFDYYTGLIFEIFDTNPDNRRSLYGGGRYDNLIGLFSNDELSGIGFGLGDVTLENFLRTHKLLPDLNKEETVFIALMEDSELIAGMRLAESLRKENIRCEQMLDGSVKLGKQIALAEKKGYNFVLIQGKNEILKNSVNVKNLKKSEQNEIPLTELISYLKKEIES
ncbi:MAG: ATP phosphoribosyltransferase regulatory subunit, partial [Leptospira sp.]|nr:ATP phosphoribosyltransferase regulatory subunit [Leptospira sp.]